MEIILDTIAGAEVDLNTERSAAVRSAVVTDIPAAARSDPFVLARAMMESGGPTLYEPHPYFPNMRVMRITAKPVASTNDAEVQFHYEGPPQGDGGSGGAAILVVEDDASLATETTEIDLQGRPIQAIYKVSVESETGGSENDITAVKTVPMSVERPRRVLRVSGLLFGRKAPSSWSREAVGYVNDAPWPTGSLWSEDISDPIGYWLCEHVSASVDRYKYRVFEEKMRPYRVRASFKTRVYRDWGSEGAYRNLYGNIPKDVGDTDEKVAAIREVRNSKYDWTTQLNADNGGANGVVKACLYKTSPFATVFGF